MNSTFEVPEAPAGIRDVLNKLFREKRLARNVFVATLLIGALLGAMMGIVYQAEARILVLPNREFVLNQEPGTDSGSLSVRNETIVLSESEFFYDRQLLLSAIEKIGIQVIYKDLAKKIDHIKLSLIDRVFLTIKGLIKGEPKAALYAEKLLERQEMLKEQAVIRFEKDLKVWTVKDASIINLSFKHHDPVVAAEALSALISVYQDHRVRTYSQIRSGMFKEQRDRFGERLATIENKLTDFRITHKIDSFPEQKSLLVRQKAELTASLIDAETKLQEVEGRVKALHAGLLKIPKEVIDFKEDLSQDSASNARTTLVTLEARRNELVTKFKEDSQYVVDIEQQIAGMKQILAGSRPLASSNRRLGRNPVLGEMESDLARRTADAAALKSRWVSLKGHIVAVSLDLESFDRLESTYDALQLERQFLEENLKTYSHKVEEALILEEMDRQRMDNVRVMQPPSAPHQGVNFFVLMTLVAIVIGVIFALAAVFLRTSLRQVYLSPADVEEGLGIPVLLSIPYRDTKA